MITAFHFTCNNSNKLVDMFGIIFMLNFIFLASMFKQLLLSK